MTWVLLGLLAVSALARFLMASSVLMLGDDQIGYLTAVDAIRSGDLTGGIGWRHLSVAYYMLPFTTLFGDLLGGKIAACLASVLIGIPAYLLTLKVTPVKPMALFAALALVWMPHYGSVLAYGFAYLLSLALALAVMLTALEFAETDKWRYLALALLAGAVLSLVNMSAALPLLVVLLVWGLLLFRAGLFDAACGILILGVPAVLVGITVLTIHGIPEIHLRSLLLVMLAVIISVVLSAAAFYARQLTIPARLLLLSLGIAFAIVGLTGDDRYVITTFGRVSLWLPIPLILTGVYWLNRIPIPRVSVVAVLAFALMMATAWQPRFESMLKTNSTLTPKTLAAIGWLEEQGQQGESVVTYPESLGWQVARLTKLSTLPYDPVDRTADSNCLLGFHTDCNSSAVADKYNVRHVLIYDGERIDYKRLP